jgi:signal transduction histidine kinase
VTRTISSRKKESPVLPQTTQCLDRRHPDFESVYRFVDKLGATFDVGLIASGFLTTIMEQLGAKRASLYLVEPGSTSLEPYRALGIAEGATLPGVPLESGLVRWLLEAGGSVQLDEFLTGTPGAAGEEEKLVHFLVDAGFSSAIALAEHGGVMGMLVRGGDAGGRAQNETDDELLSMLTRVASIMIRNAFFHQETLGSKLELERFSDMKRAFMGDTSRELQTPITVLKSTLWSLEPDRVDEGVLIDMAKDAVQRLQGTVESLLSLNDLELDRTEFRFEPSEVSSIVEDVLREILPELEEKQVCVVVDDRARFRKILIDPGKIAIVIRGILDNAVNAVDRGGNISVTIRVSESPPESEEGAEIGAGHRTENHPRRRQDATYLVVSMKDDRICTPAAEIEALAESITNASSSTDRNGTVPGIGLSVSQKVVAGHGGMMFCKGEPGGGAQFSIWLPLDM